MNEDEDFVINSIKPRIKKPATELESDINSQLDEFMAVEATLIIPDLVGPLAKYTQAAPSSIPKLLECTPIEFMSIPIEHFKSMCEKHTYTKVISSLTYIQNITSQHNQDVINRVLAIKEAIKS